MARKIAAFDFDGTLCEGDAVLPFCASVAGYPKGALALLREAKLVLDVALGDGDRDALKKSFVRRMLANREIALVEDKGRQFAQKQLRKIFPKMQERVDWHREQGHELVMVSASLEVYLQPFRELIDFDVALCTRLQRSGMLFTGELDGNNVRADEKRVLLQEFIGNDEAEVWAYGNSKDDFAMLESVQHPFLVDKDGNLKDFSSR